MIDRSNFDVEKIGILSSVKTSLLKTVSVGE